MARFRNSFTEKWVKKTCMHFSHHVFKIMFFFFPTFLMKEISGLKSPRFSGGPFLATFSFYNLDAHYVMSTYVFQILIEIADAHVFWLGLDMLVSRRKKYLFLTKQPNSSQG